MPQNYQPDMFVKTLEPRVYSALDLEGFTTVMFQMDERPEWESDTAYFTGSGVSTSEGDFRVGAYTNLQSGESEPTWSVTSGLADNEVYWDVHDAAEYGGLPFASWEMTHLYTDTQYISAGGYVWASISTGTSGGSEPDWATAAETSGDTTDGTVTWFAVSRWRNTWQADTGYGMNVIADGQFLRADIVASGDDSFLALVDNSASKAHLPDEYVATSGGVEPTWPSSVNYYAEDNEIIWQHSTGAPCTTVRGIISSSIDPYKIEFFAATGDTAQVFLSATPNEGATDLPSPVTMSQGTWAVVLFDGTGMRSFYTLASP